MALGCGRPDAPTSDGHVHALPLAARRHGPGGHRSGRARQRQHPRPHRPVPGRHVLRHGRHRRRRTPGRDHRLPQHRPTGSPAARAERRARGQQRDDARAPPRLAGPGDPLRPRCHPADDRRQCPRPARSGCRAARAGAIRRHAVAGGLERPGRCPSSPMARFAGPDFRRFVHDDLIRTHLAAAVRRGGRSIGTLAVGSRSERAYAVDAVETLASLAGQAAIAIERDRLQRELRELAIRAERERIAREMHDGLAQVLGLRQHEVAGRGRAARPRARSTAPACSSPSCQRRHAPSTSTSVRRSWA